MKNQLITLLLFVFTLSTALAQNEPDTVIYTKDKVINVFGNTWKYSKNEEGKWILEVEEDDEVQIKDRYKSGKRKFRADFNTELGINLVNPTGEMPDVKPWGSWYYAINIEGIYKPAKNFHLISSIGVNWYNFKLEDRSLIAVKNPDGITWEEFEGGTGTKSKISASYVNFTLVPTVLTNNQKLRLGLGGYAGLRIGGRGKFVYDDENGDKQKLFEKSNMYVENFRYGARGEIGVGDVTLFFNYDLNNLFQENLGPEANAMSFGITIR
ncbi:hypothetical protein JYB64_10635 [Algoriphagus aestuarii]|nr:hypothetical protein [Algoriphagus aestuarii]